MNSWINRGLIIKADNEFKTEPFLNCKMAAFESLFDMFWTNHDRILAYIGFAWEEQFSVVQFWRDRSLEHFYDSRGDIAQVGDTSNGVVHEINYVLSDRSPHVPYLKIKKQNAPLLVEYEVGRGGN